MNSRPPKNTQARKHAHARAKLKIMATLKILSEAAAKASTARAAALARLQRRRSLISPDEAIDIVGTEFQAIRSVLLKLGARVGPRANPADLKLAETLIGEIIALNPAYSSHEDPDLQSRFASVLGRRVGGGDQADKNRAPRLPEGD